MKKSLYENLLAPDGALANLPGYGSKDPLKNYSKLYTYVLAGIKHDADNYDPNATEPDCEEDELYNEFLVRKLSHAIIGEIAAAEKKVEDETKKKAMTKKNNEQSEVLLGLRENEKCTSASLLGKHSSSCAHSVIRVDTTGTYITLCCPLLRLILSISCLLSLER